MSVFDRGQGSADTHTHARTHREQTAEQRGHGGDSEPAEVKDKVLFELTTSTLVTASAIKPFVSKKQINIL